MSEQTTESDKFILVVDDDRISRTVLNQFLSELPYKILEAEDGVQGLSMWQKHGKSIGLIITDWYMPNMDGLNFIQNIAQSASGRVCPIIMQTNNTDEDALMSAHNAGASVFLTKPLDKYLLLSIIRSLMLDDLEEQSLEVGAKISDSYLSCHLKTLEQVKTLEEQIANFYPNPEIAKIGIHELLVNAIEHGNLDIGYQEKSELLKAGRWMEEIHQRLKNPEYQSKKVSVELIKTDSELRLVIDDEGHGFEPDIYLVMTPERMLDLHGRGIALSKKLSFDDITYLGKGNKVIARKFLS